MLSVSSKVTQSDLPVLSAMQPISLEEMAAVSLMNRTDTKYVTTASKLAQLLDNANVLGYRALEIDEQRLLGYESVYYDTDDLEMFTSHRNRKLFRKKIRVRTYKSSGLTFLEVKRKNNHGRTKKKRIVIPKEETLTLSNAPGAEEFITKLTEWKASSLTPETTTDFDRITIVNNELTERITIDLNLCFSNFRSGNSADLGGLVIVEVKQDGLKRSVFKDILLKHRVFPFRLSKYCIAVSITDPSARIGRFKEKIRHIEKLLS